MSAITFPPPINRLPIGLLALLGIQNGGRYPDYLVGQVSPTLSMLEWYLAQTIEPILQAPVAVNAVGNFDLLAGTWRVPDNEVWYVHGLHVRATLGAGQTMRLRAAWIPAGISGIPAKVSQSAAASANELLVTQTAPAVEKFFAGPGSAFIGICEQISAGPINVTGNIGVTRLRGA